MKKPILTGGLICLLLLSPVTMTAMAETSQQDTLKMLDQLDQLDRLDQMEFDDAIEAGYRCADDEDFVCADKEIKKARPLMFNQDSKQRLNELIAYRKDQEKYYKEKQRLAAQRKLEARCASRCPIARQYSQCVAGRLDSWDCRDEAPSYNSGGSSSGGTMAALSSALTQLNSQLQADLARQKADFNRQMQAIEAQRQAKERQKREQQAQQRRVQQQQQKAMANLQQQQEQARRQAEQRRQAEALRRKQDEERRLAEEKRRQEKEARVLAQQRAKEEEARNKQIYLSKLTSGARMGARSCYGEKHVFATLPVIKPELVSCVNVNFTVQCSSTGPVVHRGVLRNHVNMNAGSCFGDTTQVPSSVACPAKQFVVRATSVEGC
ncbi:hypothetical protein [Marinomonas posidonica]|uniref:hypothetical protein n=1 Tax=Marinomonas posidonica TaxID=936476 RepID=UPI0037354406